MRLRSRSLLVAVAVALVVPLGACSSSGSGKATATATTAKPPATVAPAAGPVDCAAVQAVLGTMAVNWQVIVQLQKEPDVKQWTVRTQSINGLKGFAGELDALQAQLGRDAAVVEALTYMRGAGAIALNGLGGDVNAPKDLATYLGTDMQAAMTRAAPIAQALATAGC